MSDRNCNGCNNYALYPYSTTCLECGGSPKNRKSIRNADKIKQAGNESEMASAFIDFLCRALCIGGTCKTPDKACHQCVLDWLKQEATNE